jgi:Cu-Zn family superoxide dismutase
MRVRWMAVCGLGFGLGVAAVCIGAADGKANKYSFKLMDAKGGDAGKVTFTQKPGAAVKMHVELKNVPFGDHAVHIHMNAVCDAPDFKGAGGHFNPDKKQHGWDNPMGHHNGDLPKNVSVGEDHTGDATFELSAISLDPAAPNSIFANGGTAVVVHEKADDMKTDPTGNAGNRIACAVVKN